MTYTVVTVDDEPMIKRTLKKLIDATGNFQVIGEAEDGGQALQLVEEMGPDLLITDIRMPVMDGLELIRELKNRRLKTEIVIISGYDEFSYAQQAIQYGVSDYLLKPLKPESLSQTLQKVLNKFRLDRQAVIERKLWLQQRKSDIQQLAEHMWLLNEEEVNRRLRFIIDGLLDGYADSEQRGSIFVELLTAIVDALTDRTDVEVRLEEVIPETVAFDSADLRTIAESRVSAIMDKLRETRSWGNHRSMHRAVEYIKLHYADGSLAQQEVADHIAMSPAYFSRSFKQEMGVSFTQYVTQLRMELAQTMLVDPLCKTYEIAHSIGYLDYPHFAKVFKKWFGVSPTEYRKRLGVQ
jgi:two-component system response regulator YesN